LGLTVGPSFKVTFEIEIDYSKDNSIKQALAGVHVVQVVIITIRLQAIDVQMKIAVAAKEVGVQLFCPSEFGGISENEAEVIFAAKAATQKKLKAKHDIDSQSTRQEWGKLEKRQKSVTVTKPNDIYP
jgi:NmrA-like family protein